MKRLPALAILLAVGTSAPTARYEDRFVWIFGWGLGRDEDVPEIARVLEVGSRHGLNGAVVSCRLDTLCKKTPDYFRRLEELKKACEANRMEFIPAVFSVGYGGAALSHDRYLAEGLPVEDAPFVVRGGEARIQPDETVRLVNGGFEDFVKENRLKGYNFHDQPGEVGFRDDQVKRGGRSSLRMENFSANPHGHGRVMQEVSLRPRRCYRMSLWVRTEGLKPEGAFRMLALAGKRELAPRTFRLPATGDWRRITTIFNSMGFESVRLYAGVWGAEAGKIWLDDWTVEEVGPVNVLRRPGTPVVVKGEDGAVYEEGRDYAPLVDPKYRPYDADHEAPPLKPLPGGRIAGGQRLRVSWYHPMVIHESQVTVCMGEPALYEMFDHEAKLLAEKIRPRRVLLNMDEIRMGGTCRACRGRNMAELLGECITRQVGALRRHIPRVEVYIWSDMLDPHHNARGDYYLVEGDYTGSWERVPKDLTIAVWGAEPREKNLKFFADLGFRTLGACYYDADDLEQVKGWLDLARRTPRVRGLMYTSWRKKYALLPGFGDLLRGAK